MLIREPEDEQARRQKSVISNVQREDIGPVEMAEALQGLMDEDKGIKTQDDLTKLIGKDKAWVSGMLRILTLPPKLQRQVGKSQLSVNYDSMIRIARLDEPVEQERLVEAVLGGATHREIREKIDRIKGKPVQTAAGSSPKPKRVYHTKHGATVIIQSETTHLSYDQVIEALQEALGHAVSNASSS